MVHDFEQFSSDSEMVCIFNHGVVKAYYGQEEADHFGTFSVLSNYDAHTKSHMNLGFSGYPVLVYDWSKHSKDFIENNRNVVNSIYNNFDNMKLGKLSVLRKLVADGVDWLPKTAFTADEGWNGIKFPAICKAANSYDSKGVEKIDSKRDVPDYIDIVQNIIPIDREFRVIAFRGKSNDKMQILQLLEKTPKNDKAKDLRVVESLSKEEMKNRPNTKFTWKMLDMNEEKALLPDISKIVKYLFNDNSGLNFAGFDIAFDTDGKGWYIEHNIMPAPVGPMFLLLYKAMFEDWYNRPLCKDMCDKLKELAPLYCKGTKKKVALEWTDCMSASVVIL